MQYQKLIANMKAKQRMARNTAKENALTLMAPTTTESGRWDSMMVRANLNSSLATPTKESGKTAKGMDLVC